jgi:hypothetical protein
MPTHLSSQECDFLQHRTTSDCTLNLNTKTKCKGVRVLPLKASITNSSSPNYKAAQQAHTKSPRPSLDYLGGLGQFAKKHWNRSAPVGLLSVTHAVSGSLGAATGGGGRCSQLLSYGPLYRRGLLKS